MRAGTAKLYCHLRCPSVVSVVYGARVPHFAYLALIVYALLGVGVCCDDFPEIVQRTSVPPVETWTATPVLIATHGLAYAWIGYQKFWLYDLLKIGWVALAYAMAYRFGTLWFTPARAALFSALFLLYPAHESTVFWYSNQYLMLTSSFFLFAYWLAARGRLAAAVAMGTLAAFVSYGSPPWGFGLALVFLVQRKFREAAALALPQLAYVAYYVVLTVLHGIGSKRLPGSLDVIALAKQFALQVAGGVDSVLGPSFALKLWWSVGSVTLVSAIVAAAIWLLAMRVRPDPVAVRLPRALWLGAAAVALGGFGMFALTGGYPQSPFGLGNRVTIYASFPVALAIAALPLPRAAYAAATALLVLATVGAADHWRAWRGVQDRTMDAIRAHPGLGRGNAIEGTLFVVGRDYSRLGRLAHVALFTETWMADAVFRLALGEHKDYAVVPLSARFRDTPGGLLDTKHGHVYRVGERASVYFVEEDALRVVARDELAAIAARARPPPRHWIQLVDAPWIGALVLRWMPQLAYLFAGNEGKIGP